jgi:WD40 repeat protein
MFDPYHKWLGIHPDHRPPTHYQLLGISPDEQDREVIEEAAIRQTAHVRTYQLGPHAADCTRILNEIAQARTTLLNPAKRKDYDTRLAAQPTRPKADQVTATPAPRLRESARPAGPAPRHRPAAPQVTAVPSVIPVAAADTDFAALGELTVTPARAPARTSTPKWPLFVALGGVGFLALIAAGVFLVFGLRSDKPKDKVAVAEEDKSPPSAKVIDTRPSKPTPKPGPDPDHDPQPRHGPDPRPEHDPAAPTSPMAQEVGRLEGHGASVNSLAFSPDGRTLLSAAGAEMWLWDVATRQVLHRFEGHEGMIHKVVFSPDGRYALSASGNVVRLWDIAKRKMVRRLEGHQTLVKSVVFSPNGRRCLSGGGGLVNQGGKPVPVDCTVRLWDLATGKELLHFEGQTLPVEDVAFGPDGQVSACSPFTGMTWDGRTGKLIQSAVLRQPAIRPCFSADGRRVTARCADGSVRVWDTDSWKEIGPVLQDTGTCHALALSADGRGVLVGHGHNQAKPGGVVAVDSTARLLDLDGRQEVAHMAGHAWWVVSVALSRQGYAATGSHDRIIRLWDIRKYLPAAPDNPPPEVAVQPPEPEKAKRPVPDEAKQVEALKLIRDLFKEDYAKRKLADRLALAAQLLDKARETDDDPVARFVLLCEARDLAAQGGDAVAVLVAIDELAKEYTVKAIDMKLTALTATSRNAHSPAANKVLAESFLLLVDEALAAENFEAAERLTSLADAAAHKTTHVALVTQTQARDKEVKEIQKEHEAAKEALAKLEKNPDDAEANLTAGRYLCLRRDSWDKGLPLLARGSDAVLQAAAKKDLDKPQGTAAQMEAGDSWWDLGETQKDSTRKALLARAGHWYREALPELMGLSLAKVEGRLKTIAEQTPASSLTEAAGELRRFSGHSDRIVGVSLSRDGRRALSGSVDGTARLWDVETGKELRRLPDINGEIRCVALSPDGHYATVGTTMALWVWDTKAEKYLLVRHRGMMGSIAFSADGRQIAATSGRNGMQIYRVEDSLRATNGVGNGGWGKVSSIAISADGSLVFFPIEEGTVLIWGTEIGKHQVGALHNTGEVLSLACSPDGRYVATAGADKLIRIWDAASGQVVRLCKGHRGRVTSVAFSGDGRRLLSGSDDRTVRLWDARTGRELQSFAWHTGKVTSVALSADGRRAISGSDDKTVRVWAVLR